MDAYSVATLGGGFRSLGSGTGATILWGKGPNDPVHDFACSTAAGLELSPRRLECRFLYDAKGSALFDRITEQPEYYLTGTEAGILASQAHRIRTITGPVTILELGSGSSAKTDHLLRAWLAQGDSVRYVPVDVSHAALLEACRGIGATHPSVRVIGVNTDYHNAFSLFQDVSPLLALFLGSSIGNLPPEEMSSFLGAMAGALSPGDFFLVGIDLVKDPQRIEAAYNDAAGVTAEFTKNIFARMNRELGSAVDLSAIDHVARYNPAREQVEIGACFTRSQTIRIAPIGKSFTVGAGEAIATEISRKFRLEEFLPYVEDFGFVTEELFTDPRDWFALVLLRRTATTNRFPAEGNS